MRSRIIILLQERALRAERAGPVAKITIMQLEK